MSNVSLQVMLNIQLAYGMIPPNRDSDRDVAGVYFSRHHWESQVQQKGETGSFPNIGEGLKKLQYLVSKIKALEMIKCI